MTERALSKVTILDLTQFEAGTTCTEFLGWLGANVIKIEGPSGDVGRSNRPEVPGLDSMYFMVFNSNKRSIVIDLKKPEGRDLLLRMLPHADVVIENYAPGTMERLNLDYPVLREINPRIVMARLKGFGLSGPYKNFKAFDMIAQAAGGALSVTGFADNPPVRCGLAIADTGTGVHAAAAIMAALLQREHTGRGQLVECSMQEVIANLMRGRYVDHYRMGAPADRRGNDIPGAVPADVFRCKGDGPNDYAYIYVQPAIPRMWVDFVNAIGRPDLIDDPRCKDVATRREHADEINAIVSEWASKRTKHEVMRILGEAGVPCSAVFDTGDLLDDPHMNERGSVITVDHPTRGKFRMPNCPVRLSDSPAVTTPSPLLGQHTDEILKELLDVSEGEIADLRSSGIIK